MRGTGSKIKGKERKEHSPRYSVTSPWSLSTYTQHKHHRKHDIIWYQKHHNSYYMSPNRGAVPATWAEPIHRLLKPQCWRVLKGKAHLTFQVLIFKITLFQWWRWTEPWDWRLHSRHSEGCRVQTSAMSEARMSYEESTCPCAQSFWNAGPYSQR